MDTIDVWLTRRTIAIRCVAAASLLFALRTFGLPIPGPVLAVAALVVLLGALAWVVCLVMGRRTPRVR